MKIQQSPSINFGSATLNILSIADNHGDILGIPQVIKTIQSHKDDIFEKKDKKSTKNVLAIAGDYFMNPAKKGILTNPKSTFGDVQYSFLLKLIYETQRVFNQRRNFSTIYTPGNHCYGGGDDKLYEKLYQSPLNTLISNIDSKKSPIVAKIMKKNHIIQTQKVIEIPDSKDNSIKNHVLFLGVVIPSTYYHPKGLKYTHFYDQTPKNECQIGKDDLQETIKLLDERIKNFKKKHPKGAVVLLSHTGNKISTIFANNVKNINVILNGHDHKDFETLVGRTQILSHGQNNSFVRGINIRFDDNGKLELIKNEKYYTAPYIKAARKDDYLQKFIQKYLEKDLEPLIKLEDEIKLSKEFLYSNAIRYKNSILANLITSAIKTAAQTKYPDVDIVGIPATIIRNGLISNAQRTTFNNIDLFNMFKGVDENVAGLSKGTITGQELINLILENVRNNLASPTRNALIQWSDIQINKTEISNCLSAKNKKDINKFIKVRNPQTNTYEEINPEKNYCILLADKYLIKNSKLINAPAKIRDKFSSISETYDMLFKEYINIVNKKVQLTDELIEKRIL